MTTFKQTQQEQIDQLTVRAWVWTSGMVGTLLSTLGLGLRGLAGARAAVPSANATVACSEIFARALHQDSNRAMDWLYYAAQISDCAERRYCTDRALQIDPHSPIVRAEARRLRRG
ncbi:MAG: hypothetical protein OHK0015_37240 [Chloroflexi bacterium OHK40]